MRSNTLWQHVSGSDSVLKKAIKVRERRRNRLRDPAKSAGSVVTALEVGQPRCRYQGLTDRSGRMRTRIRIAERCATTQE